MTRYNSLSPEPVISLRRLEKEIDRSLCLPNQGVVFSCSVHMDLFLVGFLFDNIQGIPIGIFTGHRDGGGRREGDGPPLALRGKSGKEAGPLSLSSLVL